jgi:hypothetical protein
MTAPEAPEEELLSLEEAIARLVRGGWDELQSSVVDFGGAIDIADTKATMRCHFVRSDPNGSQRVTALARQLADQVVHYCIPRSDIEAAQALSSDRTPQAITRLAREAEKLFTQNQVKTGEGAELLLYALLEKQLGIPQVLSKMSLKTSTEMQIHGADGVHAKLLENGDLAVYWGEAKMYESVADAMSDCLDSLAPYLVGRAHEQDVFLIKHFADTGNETLTASLLEYFDDGSMMSANVEMRGACLIGFSHDQYPNLPRELDALREGLQAAVDSWAAGMRTRIRYRNLADFVIEVFIVPVPSAQDFRDAIKRELGIPVTE